MYERDDYQDGDDYGLWQYGGVSSQGYSSLLGWRVEPAPREGRVKTRSEATSSKQFGKLKRSTGNVQGSATSETDELQRVLTTYKQAYVAPQYRF